MAAEVFLLTDFGLEDTYVGEMKAVLAGEAQVAATDLAHSVRPGDLRHGAFLLKTVLPVLPEGSVTAAVVDPGVGSQRGILAARREGRLFLAPDNGLLPLALGEGAEYRALENPSLRRREVSRTFHGRDIFAVAAGRLACGLPFQETGPETQPVLGLSPLAASRISECEFEAEVIHIDHFGNLVTLYEVPSLPSVEEVLIEGRKVPYSREGYYSKVPTGSAPPFNGSGTRLGSGSSPTQTRLRLRSWASLSFSRKGMGRCQDFALNRSNR